MANAWIVKRPKKKGLSYRVMWRIKTGVDAEGQPTYFVDSDTFPTAADANTFLINKKKELNENPHASSIDHALTFKEFAEQEYLEKYSKLEKSPRTYKDADKPAVDMFSSLYGSLPLTAIKPMHIANFKAWLFQDRQYSRNSVAMRLRALKAVFMYARTMNRILTVPFPKKFIPEYDFTGRYLEESELEKFLPILKAEKEVTWRAVCFDLFTGLRSNELIALDWSKVRADGERRIMTIERKGAYRRTTKVKKRDVVIPPDAWGFMGAPQRQGQVFRGLSKTVLEKAMLRAAQEAKLGPDAKHWAITAHDIRHTWATNFMKDTGDLPGLMMNGGWDSLEAVAVYQHFSKGRAESMLKVKYPGLATILLPNQKPTEECST